MTQQYQSTYDELVRRIRVAAVEHPEVLTLTDPWKLFDVPGFTCSDLDPSLAQAAYALHDAKKLGAMR